MNDKYTKRQRRKLRELSEKAHEAELNKALNELYENFNDWNAGKINAFELNELIHKFHNGKSREIYNLYNSSVENFAVARAIVSDFLKQDNIDDGLLRLLEKEISFYKEENPDND